MSNKLLKVNQEKIQNFTKLLRKKLLSDGCHKSYVNALSTEQILKDFRICADCDEEIYTPDQQMHAILEFDTAERAYSVLYEEEQILDNDETIIIYDDYEEESEEDSDEDIEVIRGRWVLDGCATIDEAIESTKCFLEHLESMQDQGYDLIEPVEDDCGYLKRHDET